MIYDGIGLEDLKDTVDRAILTLSSHMNDFDFIVATGLSGIIVAAPVAYQLDKPLAVLRKPDDKSNHDCRRFIGKVKGRALWIDDFISTGHTYRRVRDSLVAYAEAYGVGITYAGCYLYSNPKLTWAGDGMNPLDGEYEARMARITDEDRVLIRIKAKMDESVWLTPDELKVWYRHYTQTPDGEWVRNPSGGYFYTSEGVLCYDGAS